VNPLLWLAHVHRVTTRVGGAQREVFIFDHHRSAFTLWAHAVQRRGRPLTLVTLDRHMDLGRPAATPPPLEAELAALDGYARLSLGPANDEHVVAAMEAGAIGDALVVARSHEPPSLAAFRPYVDAAGRRHRCGFARTIDLIDEPALELVLQAEAIALDIDLDCFTTLSDGHPDEVLAWDADQIDGFLRPPGWERFWTPLLERCELVTVAREPYHCGGFTRGARLWLAFAEVFFERLLGVPPP
jgi:hypothetical protein